MYLMHSLLLYCSLFPYSYPGYIAWCLIFDTLFLYKIIPLFWLNVVTQGFSSMAYGWWKEASLHLLRGGNRSVEKDENKFCQDKQKACYAMACHLEDVIKLIYQILIKVHKYLSLLTITILYYFYMLTIFSASGKYLLLFNHLYIFFLFEHCPWVML